MKTLIIVLASVAAAWVIALVALMIAGRRTAAHELAALLPNVVALFKGLLRDPRVPRRQRALLLVGIAWVASPIDLIPEFLPVIGPLDDIIVVALILRHLVRASGEEIVLAHWRGDERIIRRILGASAGVR